MRTTSCLTAASSILFATIALTPVQAQDEVVGRTCRAALEGYSFRLSDPPQDTNCCYVEPEVPWYLEQVPIVAENRYYLRDDGQNVYTLTCDIDHGATGSIGSVTDGNNGGIGVTPRLEDGDGNGDDNDNVDNENGGDNGDSGGLGNPGNNKPKGHAGEEPGPGDWGDGIKGKSQ